MQDCSVLQLGADISWTYSNSSFLIYKALMNCSCPLSSKNEWEWWCNFFEREASERLAAGLYILIKRLVRLIEVDPESCGQTLWTPLTVWSGRKERQRERDRLFKRVAAVVLWEEITVASLHKWTPRAPLAAFRRNMQDGTGDWRGLFTLTA